MRLCASAIQIASALSLWSGVYAQADDVVQVGAGGYTTRLPEGAKAPQSQIYRTANAPGPMPTNDWWSSLAWEPFSSPMFPHPLAVRAVEGGLRVAYPGATLTANASAIFGGMPDGADDFTIGCSGVEKFHEARVDGFGDWTVSALFVEGAARLRTTFGHGMPFVFATVEGGKATLTFGKEAPQIWSGSAKDAVLGVSVKGRHYGVFAPTGTEWSDLAATKWIADAKERNYFAIAVLPDAKPETLALFARYAYNHVTGTRVSWSYDEKRAAAQTSFAFTTKSYEGAATGTLFALYPHQWTHTDTKLSDLAYASVRGPMKLGAGASFRMEMTFPGALPSLPISADAGKTLLGKFVTDALAEPPKLVADTYWIGKQLGKHATLLPIAEQLQNQPAVDTLTTAMRASLENFFTAERNGAAKKASDGVFYYDANWGTLIGYPASYGSDDQLNDHHFHYGYFLRAAGELARRDPAWAAKWGDCVKLLARDIASADREDKLFPFLRAFDPYAGHSWASGHARFGDGNNNESSSEAVNAWYGLILWGEATGDRALRDLGAWLFTTEIEAIDDYWFDVTQQFHHKDFPASVVTMVWGGKGANGTWFSGNPEAVHGINWLPFTGASLYLGRYPEYCVRNYAALVAENKADDAKKHRANDGRTWDQWADLIWMFRGLSDPQDAFAQFTARAPDYKAEDGNTLANVYLWLTTLAAFGQVDRTITADTPSYAVFTKAGKRTHVAYNFAATPRQVTFSDGVKVMCAPHAFGIAR